MEALIERCRPFLEEARGIWTAGGWCMAPIAVTAFILAALGLHVNGKLNEKGFRRVKQRTWRKWVDRPERAEGPVGDLLRFVATAKSVKEAAALFAEARASDAAPFARDFKVIRVCISAAPLFGLLGTVTGMLATFQALATGSGGEQTMGMIAKGISEALITTEAGLVVALPGVYFNYFLARKYDKYKVFLAHLETVFSQRLYRRLRAAGAPA